MKRTLGPLTPLVAALLALLLVGACALEDDPTEPEQIEPPLIDGVGTVSGVVYSTGGFPLSGASVSAGEVSTSTNEDGYFVLTRVPAGDTLVRIGSGTRFVLRRVALAEGGSVHLADQVIPSYTFSTFDADDGASIETDGGVASLTIEPESLITESGAVYHGNVLASLAALPPQYGDFYGAFPSGFEGLGPDDSVVPLESFGFVGIILRDNTGATLQLAPGQTATLRLEVSGEWIDLAPDTLGLWRLEAEDGYWRDAGSAFLTGDVYSASLTRLATVNFARTVEEICGVTGFVVNDSQQPAVGVRVISRGVDRAYRDEAVTNADGRFTVQAISDGIADVWAVSGSLQGEALRVSVGNDCPESAAEDLVVTVPAFTIALTWGAQPPDLDSHLLVPMPWDADYDHYHIAFFSMGRLGENPYAVLDVDDTSGFGPEVITSTRVFQGRFAYWVHEYETEDTEALAASGAMVQLVLGGALYLFEVDDVPTDEADESGWWHVFDIEVDGAAIELVPVMRFEPRFSDDRVYAPETKRSFK